ncbi:MAG: ATP-dependent DNA helicase RecG [Parcubacteria group bacterium]|nr:ATP-dependent DNA helicase RecG [Parcubacteria group bacterium]
MSEFSLITPIERVGKIAKSTVKQMQKLGVATAKDLLFYFPARYEDWSKIMTIQELKKEMAGTVKGKVIMIVNRKSNYRGTTLTEAIVSDGKDSLKVIWFNQPWITKSVATGDTLYMSGKIEIDEQYGLQMVSPSYELATHAPVHTSRIVPIYHLTERLSQKQLRTLIKNVIYLAQDIEDFLPREVKSKFNFISLQFALEQIHFPENKKWLEKAERRLKFDELLVIQLRNYLVKEELKKLHAPQIIFNLEETKNFTNSLPFQLTDDQKKSAWEIIKDMELAYPMNRLLQGEVGSGKTIVSAIAFLNTALSGQRVVYMAPTEILATQQFNNFCGLFKGRNFHIVLFTRSQRKSNQYDDVSKKEILEMIKKDTIDLLVGTHTLIQEEVQLKKLGLVIVDEQHRFGVEQRGKLLKDHQDVIPHFLSMTATPIPRSMSLTLYGDLSLSVIKELPQGRKKVITEIITPERIDAVYQFIRSEIQKGHQGFVICPLIDPSDALGVKSVQEEYTRLSKEVFPDLKLAILHGKMSGKEKDEIREKFYAHDGIDLLISTTVVEVGIDVPNATVLFIEGAERFGLAQLYQLRGRVGRSEEQSYCFLHLENPSDKAMQRMNAFLQAKNALELAEKDLEMRGPGEVFGTSQSGFVDFLKIAKLTDFENIKEAQVAAEFIMEQKLLLKYPNLQKKIKQDIKTMHLE